MALREGRHSTKALSRCTHATPGNRACRRGLGADDTPPPESARPSRPPSRSASDMLAVHRPSAFPGRPRRLTRRPRHGEATPFDTAGDQDSAAGPRASFPTRPKPVQAGEQPCLTRGADDPAGGAWLRWRRAGRTDRLGVKDADATPVRDSVCPHESDGLVFPERLAAQITPTDRCRSAYHVGPPSVHLLPSSRRWQHELSNLHPTSAGRPSPPQPAGPSTIPVDDK
jgi:hypothetical protein